MLIQVGETYTQQELETAGLSASYVGHKSSAFELGTLTVELEFGEVTSIYNMGYLESVSV